MSWFRVCLRALAAVSLLPSTDRPLCPLTDSVCLAVRATRSNGGGNERGRPSLSALTCGRVLANLRGRGDMFSFPMIYAGKWVARAWKCHAPRYRWQVSMGKGRVRASRKNAALYRPATRYHAIPRPVHTAPPHPLPTLWNHSTRHRVENHPVIPRPRSAAPTTLTVNFVNYPRDPVPSARVRPLFWRVPGIIDGLRLRALRLLRIFFQLELISIGLILEFLRIRISRMRKEFDEFRGKILFVTVRGLWIIDGGKIVNARRIFHVAIRHSFSF